MKTLQTILSFLVGILIVLAGIGLVAGLIVVAAFGLGLLLNLLLRYQPYEATLLSLLSLGFVLIIITLFFTSHSSSPTSSSSDDEWDDEDEWDDAWDEDDEEDEEDEEPQVVVYPGVPRWRQPLKNVDFSNTRPDDRCPCGSGRKYKNCHGAKSATR
jgi:hypothetical protein